MTQSIQQDDERGGRISASDNAGWACPAKKRFVDSLPPDAPKSTPEDEEEALSGTLIHEAFETGNTLRLSEEQGEVLKNGIGFLQQLVDGWMRDYGLAACNEGPREERIWYHHPQTMEPMTSARLDRFYLSVMGDAALICDMKSGWVKKLQPSPRSTQLRVQAVCLWREYQGIKRIRVAYVKPRLKVGAEDYTDYTEIDLEAAERWMLTHLWHSDQPDAPFVAGPHCNYCPGKAYCKMAGAYSLLPSVMAANAIDKKDIIAAVDRMVPADLKRLWQSKSIVTKILDAVDTRLKGMTDEERTAIGLRVGKGRNLDPIVKVREAFAFLLESGFSEEELWSCLSMSKTDVAKLARKEKSLSSEEMAKRWVAQSLYDFIEPRIAQGAIEEI